MINYIVRLDGILRKRGPILRKLRDMIVSQLDNPKVVALGKSVWIIIGWKILKKLRLMSLSVK